MNELLLRVLNSYRSRRNALKSHPRAGMEEEEEKEEINTVQVASFTLAA